MISWLKQNKLAAALLVIVLILLARSSFGLPSPRTFQSAYEDSYLGNSAPISLKAPSTISSRLIPSPEYAPSDTQQRLVVQNTNISLVVKDVPAVIATIEQIATQKGGYMVDSSLNQPEGSASGVITVRVPSEQRKETLNELRGLSVKVVSENVYGTDVTDEYEDLQAQLNLLNQTKSKFEAILQNAVTISETLEVQRELINLQSQIDSITGRQQLLSQTAKLTKITIYLSTDELALPYAPDQAWRPQLVFKQAVRSMIASVRSLANALIWAGAYSVIWIPILIALIIIRRYKKKGL